MLTPFDNSHKSNSNQYIKIFCTFVQNIPFNLKVMMLVIKTLNVFIVIGMFTHRCISYNNSKLYVGFDILVSQIHVLYVTKMTNISIPP